MNNFKHTWKVPEFSNEKKLVALCLIDVTGIWCIPLMTCVLVKKRSKQVVNLVKYFNKCFKDPCTMLFERISILVR